MPSFEGGQFSNGRANLLQPSQNALLQNMDQMLSGELVTRRGIKQIGTSHGSIVHGIAFYQTPSYSQLVVAAAGYMWTFNGSTWDVITDGGGPPAPMTYDTNVPITFVQGVDLLYFGQGTSSLRVYNGVSAGPGNPFAPYVNTDAPFGASIFAWHTNRLCASGVTTDPDTIYFSQFLDGEVWDKATWNIRVGAGEGDPITGLVSWTGYNLIVLKQHSIWVVNCDPTKEPAEFQITKIHGSIGTMCPRTACQVGSDVFLLTDSGVRSIKNILATEQQKEVGPALSYPIADIMNRINLGALSTAHAVHWNNRYILMIPVDGATQPNTAVPFNTLTESWSGIWTGWTATCFSTRVDGDVSKLWMGQSDGTVADWMDYIPITQETTLAFQDMGVDIPSRVKTRAFTCNEPVCPKTGFRAELEFNNSSADVVATLILDDSSPATWRSFSTLQNGLTLPLTLPFTLPRAGVVRKAYDLMAHGQWRELQIDLNSTSGKLAVRSISVAAFVDTLSATA